MTNIEEIFALLFVIAFGAGIVYIVITARKKYIEYQTKRDHEYFNRMAESLREAEIKRQATIRKAIANGYATTAVPKTKTKKAYSSTSTSTASSTAPVDTWSNDLLTTMIIADTISNALGRVSESSSPSYSDSSSSSSDSYSSPSYDSSSSDSGSSPSYD